MDADTQAFVAACQVCARGKASHQPPAGLLRPLPIPSRPWSHIAVNFVTGLPPSEGNTAILTVVDRLSKSAHFIALQKLSSARETADLLVNHVIKLHGIPLDIVSDWGRNSPHRYGNCFVLPWGYQSVYPRDSIHRQMDKQSGQTKIWKQPYAL